MPNPSNSPGASRCEHVWHDNFEGADHCQKCGETKPFVRCADCAWDLCDQGQKCLKPSPPKAREARVVKWVDSCLQNGQVDESDFPEPVVITSVGFVVKETDEYLVLARDDMGHDGDFRGLCAIPKLAVMQ